MPTGAVVRLSDGVVGIDTSTGEDLWSYRMPGLSTRAAVTPDGAQAVVSGGGKAVVLDAGTGELLTEAEHGRADDDLTVLGAGMVLDRGLLTSATAGEGESGITLELGPWDEGQDGWATPLTCEDDNGATGLRQGISTQTTAVVVYECGGEETVMAGLSPASGEALWRLSSADGLPQSADTDFGVVGEHLVYQDISLHRGTLVYDAREGEVVAEDLPDELGNDLLRVLPDGYLAVHDTGDGNLSYEIRDFSGETRMSTVVPEEEAGNSITGFLPLADSLVKLAPAEEGGASLQPTAFPWNAEDDGSPVPLPVEVIAPGDLSLRPADQALGAGAFLEAPGAVLLRERTSSGESTHVVGLR